MSDKSDSDMELSSGEDNNAPETATSTSVDAEKDSMKSGADFIKFGDSESEEEHHEPPLQSATRTMEAQESNHGHKRKRSLDSDSDDGIGTGPPPGCPWMGHRKYSKMPSVPLMLTQEIKDFVAYISPTREEHQVRKYVHRRIIQAVNRIWPEARVVVFGSFETRLYLPSSDMDMVVLKDGRSRPEDLRTLAGLLRRENIGENITVIARAKVPIVKFKESISGIPVDISFNITNGIDSARIATKLLEELPVLRPLTMVLKHFLMIKRFNEVFTGGLGSYTTMIMILSFLQMHPKIQSKRIDPEDNLGTLLIEFFELYGLCFNYSEVGIKVNKGGSYFNKIDNPIGARVYRRGPESMTLTSIDPNDSSNDTGAGSFNLRKIREVFVGAYGSLTSNVQKRHRELFGRDRDRDQHGGSSSSNRSVHIRFDEKNRVPADSVEKSSGLHHQTQVSLIKDVLSIPYDVQRHRQQVENVFYEGQYQRMFGDPEGIQGLDEIEAREREEQMSESDEVASTSTDGQTRTTASISGSEDARSDRGDSKHTQKSSVAKGADQEDDDRIIFKGKGERLKIKGAAGKQVGVHSGLMDEDGATSLQSEAEATKLLESESEVTRFLQYIRQEEQQDSEEESIESILESSNSWIAEWKRGGSSQSGLQALVQLKRRLARRIALKRISEIEKSEHVTLSVAERGEIFRRAQSAAKRVTGFDWERDNKTRQQLLNEVTNGMVQRKSNDAKTTRSAQEVVYVHADDSEDEDDEKDEYFETLMRQGAKEYDDSDDEAKNLVAGHRNPDNVNSSDGSLQLPQLVPSTARSSSSSRNERIAKRKIAFNMEPVVNGKFAVQYDEVDHIYRNVMATGGLMDRPMPPYYDPMDKTMAHLFEYMANKYEDKDALGWRDIIKTHKVTKQAINPDEKPKTWITYELSDYNWMSYRTAKTYADRIGLGITRLGLEKGDHVMIFASTCPEWLLTAHGCFSQSIIIVTAYDSMDEKSIQYILDQAEPKAIFADSNTLPVVSKLMQKGNKSVKAVIYAGQDWEVSESISNKGKQRSEDDDEAKDHGKIKTVYPTGDDIACIMYTSGSTGNPKGAQLTHCNLMAAIGSAAAMEGDQLDKETDIIISYLPLAHVLEFVISHFIVSMGCRVGFGHSRTLMDDAVAPTANSGRSKGLGDLKALQPTLMAGVPTIWEKIRKGILAEVNKQSFPVRTLFFAALNTKWAILQVTGSENFVTKTIDSMVFSKAKELVGGRLRLTLTGGAGISDETHRFLSMVMCYVISGYGLTEVCGVAAVTMPRMGHRLGTVGPPAPSLEMKLVNVPDTEYTGDNGSGEIWFRGPAVMKGYFKLEKETKEVLTGDGWFKTGDIGIMNPDGTLSIKDRVKNLVKLAHGEYVALEKCEAVYRDSKEIKNICIVADNGCPVLLAIVEPSKHGASQKEILEALKSQAKSGGLSKPETIQGVIVDDSDWTKNGYMTSSSKLKRREVCKAHDKEIKEMWKKF
ncbi:long-chain fatty acid-CoA ligase [Haplosporangium sp. Z 11]|nr:long-chain fatty acid-CoA ligase [Haplosporangium sp. Z 11]